MSTPPPRLLLAVALILAGWISSAAGPDVLFADGRSMRVDAVQQDAGRTLLHLEGGGQLVIPTERIANWDEIVAWRPEPSRPAATASTPARDPLWQVEAGDYALLIDDAAQRHGLDPALLTAVVKVESAFDPRAISPKGARGLLQLMPATAVRFGVSDPHDAAQAVDGGARYLSWLLERFEGRKDLALAGYNAGEGAVERYRGVPPYPETRRYVRLVLEGATRLGRPAP